MDNTNVCILDYGSGNIKSVYNLFKFINASVKISNKPKDIQTASHLVLPGVGAFGTAVEKITNNLPLKVLTNEVIDRKKPLLGICVGMQVLASIGHEFGDFLGLNWIPGEVTKLDTGNLPLPHVGWNNIQIKKSSLLTNHFDENCDFYFVHS
ncbi:MAG: imidazole glycerol phosphate synthase subunit HisH, partial [bacterium]|nr:imidazole glycerol phosphate synthase subunit HisH [bacterium]